MQLTKPFSPFELVFYIKRLFAELLEADQPAFPQIQIAAEAREPD